MAVAYSWESFIRIHGGKSGASDMFEKLMYELLRAENPEKNVYLTKADPGDGGIDIWVHQDDGIDIYECKFFADKLGKSQKSQIVNSFNTAMQPKGVKVLRWFLCIPSDNRTDDISWLEKFREMARRYNIEINFIYGTEIITRMQDCDRLKNTDLIYKYFGERKRHFTNKNLIMPFTMSRANGAQGGTYVPRDDLLEKIEDCITKERMIFLSGIGGSGKSELARAYAHKHSDDYEEIFWLTCGETDKQSNLFELMLKVDLLRDINKEDISRFSNKVLIIVDNCNSNMGRLLHELEHGTGDSIVLVTTRLSYIEGYECIIPVKSDNPSAFTFAVFEKNYCKNSRRGICKKIRNEEESSVYDICRAVQFNTMIVSLIGIRLRDSNNLSIKDCAKRICYGVGSIEGKVKYSKDLETKSLELIDILRFLFSDILNYTFRNEQLRAVITVLSLTPATWYDINYICSLLDGANSQAEHGIAVEELLDIGCIQGFFDKISIHPLITEVLSEQNIIIKESAFFNRIIRNYLGISDNYLKKEICLIKEVCKRAVDCLPQYLIAARLMLNDDYRTIFEQYRLDIRASYFVYVNGSGKRIFYYRDVDEEETHILTEIKCDVVESDSAVLLSVYNRGGCYKLDLSVKFLGRSIKEIPSGLCYDDMNITSLVFSDETTSIGGYAFCYCKSLKDQLYFPSGIKTIGSFAFYYCSSLVGNLYLPDSITEIGNSAFSGCDSLNGTLHLSFSLERLEDNLFSSCRNLTGSLCIPDNLISIGNHTFEGCSGLNGELCLPKSLTNIGDYAFEGCNGLLITLQSQIDKTRIGQRSFYGCKGLIIELHIPESITRIDAHSFEGDGRLSKYLGESFISISDNALYDLGNKRYIKVYLPESLTSIGNDAFFGRSDLMCELHLPDGLISIGERAFYGCKNLRGILQLPKRLMSIGDYAFYDCSGLSGALIISEGLKSIGNHSFEGCKGLNGKINFPENLTSIGDYAFCGCSGLNGELFFPEGLKSIGECAFQGCKGLSGKIYFSKSLTSIGDYAFYGCTGLCGDLIFPEGLKSIGNHSFEGCKGLSGKIHFPESLTSIGDYAFYGCTGLSGDLIFSEGLKSIGDYSFAGCRGLNGEMNLPDSLISIGDYAFCDCQVLSGEIHTPKSLKHIGENAFSGCFGLKTYVQEEMLGITDYAFYNADLSGEIHFPEGIKIIGDCAYNGCTGLKGDLFFPESVTSIGSYSFYRCNGLNGIVHLSESLMRIGNYAFYGCSRIKELHFSERLKSIGAYAFYGCSDLGGELLLPDSVTSIGESAFGGCASLSGKLYLPEHLEYILDSVFYGCSGLCEQLHLPMGLISIGNWAFFGCSGLSGELQIPENLVSIGSHAFYGCVGLSGDVFLPESIKSVGANAFCGCNKIERIIFNNPNTDIKGNMNTCPSTTISGHKNSTAEKYANENGLAFEELKL